MNEHYDFLVIGSGAGGGTIANRLVLRGAKVLLLERGGFVPREEQNWSPRAVFQEGRYVSEDTWLDRRGHPFQPQAHYNVGGATKFYGAALFRLRPYDFAGVAHSDGMTTPWPMTYMDFEPWYTRAEQMYQVHGNAGEDPTEGPRSAPYPFPALDHEPAIQRLSDSLSADGLHPFHAPSGVLYMPGGNCIRCGTCDGHPCKVSAKADAETIAIRPLFDYENFTMITNAQVYQVNRQGRKVTSVLANVDGKTRSFTADTVILSAGAVNSAALLLSSHLANTSGQVGRNYMCHNSMAVMAVSDTPNPTAFQKTLALHDFYYGLGSIQMIGKSTAEAMRGESPALTALLPDSMLRRVATHSLDFWLMTEDIASPENRVTVTPSGQVQLTRKAPPLLRRTEMDGLYAKLKHIMREAGMTEVYAGKNMPLAAVAHQAGTCRMGEDPSVSVLDPFCKTHDVDNLYVVDASFMPSVGAVNPALTVMANAIRVGEHLAAR